MSRRYSVVRSMPRIDAAFVDARLKELAQSEDLARYVL